MTTTTTTTTTTTATSSAATTALNTTTGATTGATTGNAAHNATAGTAGTTGARGAGDVLILGNGPDAVRLTRALHRLGHPGPVRMLPEPVVTAIDRRRRRVRTADGGEHPYGTLALALGARPHIPDVPGLRCPEGQLRGGVRVGTPLAGPAAGRRATTTPGPVVVLGAGPDGTDAALALRRAGRQVTVVHPGAHPMSRRLDRTAGELLAGALAERGIRVHAGATAVEFTPGKLTLDDGRILEAATLLLCTGTVPHTRLAAEAGLPVGHGVLVDSRLRTADPHISALGSCAELTTTADGPAAPPAWDQAEALAARLTGADRTAPPPVVRLRDPALHLAVMGSRQALEEAPDQITLHDPARGRYARLALRRDRVAAAVVLGLPRAAAAVTQLYREARPVPAARLALLLGTPPLRPGAPDSPATVVCRCNHVTLGELREAWDRGARDVAALAEATRATTGCGSCTDEVARLCSARTAPSGGPGGARSAGRGAREGRAR
ncbi:FAD-dependent oxidoreductase [Streptomyces aidingensis]|uniref:Assimilatory nitrate reductase electron transfer subunit n=1 Tax=Streptomyces aidingensis TaxID=910347 RepID=A0A1I1FLT4_9ACTN|nr:FAD-dependent oxidoreductase [Streptomyces aidingensis]SFB98000.1 assimilatory nitrate reductase electron transfer subunit [Streptomyces aidingensis]